MHKGLLKTGAFLGALAVILGAFAAHALRSRLLPDELAIFETGVRYQMYHAFAVIIVGILYKEFPHKETVWAGRAFIFGTIIFSGTLYLLTYFKSAGNTGMFWLGAVTPVGGTMLIAGWLLLMRVFLQKTLK